MGRRQPPNWIGKKRSSLSGPWRRFHLPVAPDVGCPLLAASGCSIRSACSRVQSTTCTERIRACPSCSLLLRGRPPARRLQVVFAPKTPAFDTELAPRCGAPRAQEGAGDILQEKFASVVELRRRLKFSQLRLLRPRGHPLWSLRVALGQMMSLSRTRLQFGFLPREGLCRLQVRAESAW